MTQEEKNILLKDLSARLPYHPTVKIYNDSWEGCKIGEFDNLLYYHHVEAFLCDRIKIKPYLRPIASMTEEEVGQLFHILKINEENAKEWIKVNDIGIIRLFTEEGKDFYEIAEAMDYLHSIHIDYRRLIEKGLAIEAPEEMYKID